MAADPLEPEPIEPTAEPAAEPVAVLESPFCDELRSKRFYLMDGLATDASHYLDATGHCWCFVTQQVVGPDGKRVHPSRCVPGRACYKSAFGNKI